MLQAARAALRSVGPVGELRIVDDAGHGGGALCRILFPRLSTGSSQHVEKASSCRSAAFRVAFWSCDAGEAVAYMRRAIIVATKCRSS